MVSFWFFEFCAKAFYLGLFGPIAKTHATDRDGGERRGERNFVGPHLRTKNDL
jgi:hypothetical protein